MTEQEKFIANQSENIFEQQHPDSQSVYDKLWNEYLQVLEDRETLARAVLAQCNPTHWQGNDATCKRFACVLARKVLD